MNIKRTYFYLRQGWTVIGPVFGFGNFIMLIYLSINLDIPLYVFAPLLSIAIGAGLVAVGKLFREKQMSTDHDLNFWKAKEALKTQVPLWRQIEKMCEKTGTPILPEFVARKKLLEENSK